MNYAATCCFILKMLHSSALNQNHARAKTCLLVVGGCLLLLLVLGITFPEELAWVIGKISPGCWFRKLTGLSCPGCGGTRAVRELLQGEVWEACRHNFFLLLGLAVLIVEYMRRVWVCFFRKDDWRSNRIYARMIAAFAWLVLIWAIVRNVLGV